MPEIIKTKEVHAGYTCDMCDVMISDGEHDGCGGINWWGLTLGMETLFHETVQAKRQWDGVFVTIKRDLSREKKSWGLCHGCAAKVEEYINSA